MGMGRPIGALITKLHPFGPAIRSGIRIGDIITHVDGQRVDDTESLTFRIATRKVGEVSQLSVRRKNNVIIVSFPLELSPETPPRNKTLLKGVHPISGATVVNLSPAVAEEQGISLLTTGVLITTIKRGSPAARIVFRPGDIILRVNRNKIGSVKELLEVISRGAKVWRLAINRNSKILTITVPG